MQTQTKLYRLSFYLWLYLLPALVALSQPHKLLLVAFLWGLGPGLWRSLRRAHRRGTWDPTEGLLFALTTATMAVVVAGVTCLLQYAALPLLALVALEQAHRPNRRGGRLAY